MNRNCHPFGACHEQCFSFSWPVIATTSTSIGCAYKIALVCVINVAKVAFAVESLLSNTKGMHGYHSFQEHLVHLENFLLQLD